MLLCDLNFNIKQEFDLYANRPFNVSGKEYKIRPVRVFLRNLLVNEDEMPVMVIFENSGHYVHGLRYTECEDFKYMSIEKDNIQGLKEYDVDIHEFEIIDLEDLEMYACADGLILVKQVITHRTEPVIMVDINGNRFPADLLKLVDVNNDHTDKDVHEVFRDKTMKCSEFGFNRSKKTMYANFKKY